MNGVTKSRFEVCAWRGQGWREEGHSLSHAPKNSLRTEPPPLSGAVTPRPLGLPDFSPLSCDPKAQCSPASLFLPTGRLLPLPPAGPRRGISSGALIPPPPSITQLSILYTTLGLPPFTRQKKHHSSDRPEGASFFSFCHFLREARGKLWARGLFSEFERPWLN